MKAKQQYDAPVIDVRKIAVQDVITTSGGNGVQRPGYEGEWDNEM